VNSYQLPTNQHPQWFHSSGNSLSLISEICGYLFSQNKPNFNACVFSIFRVSCVKKGGKKRQKKASFWRSLASYWTTLASFGTTLATQIHQKTTFLAPKTPKTQKFSPKNKQIRGDLFNFPLLHPTTATAARAARLRFREMLALYRRACALALLFRV